MQYYCSRGDDSRIFVFVFVFIFFLSVFFAAILTKTSEKLLLWVKSSKASDKGGKTKQNKTKKRQLTGYSPKGMKRKSTDINNYHKNKKRNRKKKKKTGK